MAMGADDIVDRVPLDSPGVREIDFHVPDRYNASEVLFHNLAAGRVVNRIVVRREVKGPARLALQRMLSQSGPPAPRPVPIG